MQTTAQGKAMKNSETTSVNTSVSTNGDADSSASLNASEKDKFIQIRPWLDCMNNCSFCSLQNRNRKTSLEQKKIRLKKTADFVQTLDAKTIGLIGGDFFEGQLKGCETEWVGLLEALLKTKAQILITANLIHEQYFLDETINTLKNRLLLCTSYDEVGRFHTKQARANWFEQIGRLHNKEVNLFCTCIPTQDFLEAQLGKPPKTGDHDETQIEEQVRTEGQAHANKQQPNPEQSCQKAQPDPEEQNKLPEWLNINLCDPHLGVDWYIKIDKNTYHEHLIEENNLFNLPERKTAVRWMKQHPHTAMRYANYNESHSDTIYGFDENNELFKEINERLSSKDFVNPACGHPFFSQCYADSSKCMMCDAQHIAQSTSA